MESFHNETLFEGFESNYGATDNTTTDNKIPKSQEFQTSPEPYLLASNKNDLRFVSVFDPGSLERRSSSVLIYHDLTKRVDSLRSMRPFRLIGTAVSLVDWLKFLKPISEIEKIMNSDIKTYYNNQNGFIERYNAVDNLLDSGIHMSMIERYGKNDSIDSNELQGTPADIDIEGGRALGYSDSESSGIVEIAINVNFMINVFLLIGKIYVTLMTGSMSIIASLVDSILDLLSTLIIFFANRYASRKSWMFPIGRKRLEPLGVLVFSVIIIISFSQVLIESINKLLYSGHQIVNLTQIAGLIMVITIVTKVLCYIFCKEINNSSVQALAEDAKTDVIFNLFSIIFPVVGSLAGFWWLDNLGASVLATYVILQWTQVAFEHINNLSGASASKEEYQEVLYMIVRFSDNINKIKNFRTYHVGDLINVEVDIVLVNPELSMKDCHDLGESLQYAIETLPFVERCFVHLDYKVVNFLGHINK